MHKKELITAIAQKTEMTQADVEKVLKAFMEVTVAEVAKKGNVQLIGFGTFEARERPARTGINPQNGKPIAIAADVFPGFKVGKTFKDAVSVNSQKKAAAVGAFAVIKDVLHHTTEHREWLFLRKL